MGRKDTEEEIKLQLTELVRRPEQKPGEEPIENPSFQITAMYFMQKARKQKEMKITEDMEGSSGRIDGALSGCNLHYCGHGREENAGVE